MSSEKPETNHQAWYVVHTKPRQEARALETQLGVKPKAATKSAAKPATKTAAKKAPAKKTAKK